LFKLTQIYNLRHPHELEETVERKGARAKIFIFHTYSFITLPILHLINNDQDLAFEQINIFVRENLIISFLDGTRTEPFYRPILKKLKANLSHVACDNTAFVLFHILMAVMEKICSVASHYGDLVDDLELRFTRPPILRDYHEVQAVKRELLLLRKSMRPMRDVMETISKIQIRAGERLFDNTAKLYAKELERKMNSLLELIETLRELCTSMHELFDVHQDRKMNGTLYALTIITTLFIPASFLAGVYGMNFKEIPELHWDYSYPVFWGVIIIMWTIMIIVFRGKGWLTFNT